MGWLRSRLVRWLRRGGNTRGCSASIADPHEHLPLLIDSELLDANELNLQILQVVIIELKLAFKCSIRDPLALAQEIHDLIKDSIKVHLGPSCPYEGAVGPTAGHGQAREDMGV
jgi:hypothetical protein